LGISKTYYTNFGISNQLVKDQEMPGSFYIQGFSLNKIIPDIQEIQKEHKLHQPCGLPSFIDTS
jgi:hypothetical protein